MRVPPNHPLAELLGKLLFGIENVPVKEQTRMVRRASREATKWHENEVSRMRWWIKDFEIDAVLTDMNCPECNNRLGEFTRPYHPGCHKSDCDLGNMLSDKKT
jgi:hypothetical protein